MPNPIRFILLPLLLPLASPLVAAGDAPAGDADTAAAAPAAAPSVADLQKQLADVQDQLSTALHSFSLLHDENTQLKADADQAAADKAALATQVDSAQHTIAALTVEAAAANQLAILRAQLRQAQDQIAALVAENSRLKVRLSLAGAPPAGGMPVPTRPAQP
jgi:chromosome segregation ATPase